MGRILKINHDYFVEFYGNGLRFQKKAGRTEEEARAKLREIERSLAETALEQDLTTVTVSTFVDRFLLFAREIYTLVTFVRYQEALAEFENFLKEHLSDQQLMREITPRVLEEYKIVLIQKFTSKDVNLALFLVRDILEHARTLRFLNDNPTQHIQFLKEGFDAPPPILNEDLKCDSPEKEVCEFVLATGIKFEECTKLKWEDFNFKERALYIRFESNQSIQTRRIPLDPLFAKGLEEQSMGQEGCVFLNINWIEIPFKVLQNTFAYNLLQRGVPLIQLNQFLGFEDVGDVYPFGYYII